MLRQFFANFTWLDICVLCIVARACWIGFEKGFLVEIFKTVSLFFAAFIGLHFYVQTGNFLIHVLRPLRSVAHIFSYIALIGITIGISRIVRDGMIVLLRDKDSEKVFIHRIIGLILGFIRGLLLSSLFLVACLIADVSSVSRGVRQSFTAPSILSLGPKFYTATFHYVISPVFPKEQANAKILALIKFNKRGLD